MSALTPPATVAFEKLPLESVIDALSTNVPRLTTPIPSAWTITYDLNTGATAINDGGARMFDVGNILSTDLDAIAYTNNTVSRLHSGAGPRGSYFTLQLRQMFIAVTDLDAVKSFGTRGRLGTAGGTVDHKVITKTVEGATYRGFVKRTYGTSAPAVHHLFIVRDDAGTVKEDAFPSDSQSDEQTLTGLPARGRVYYVMFGARQNRVGVKVDDSQMQAVMDAFVSILGERAAEEGITPEPPAPPPRPDLEARIKALEDRLKLLEDNLDKPHRYTVDDKVLGGPNTALERVVGHSSLILGAADNVYVKSGAETLWTFAKTGSFTSVGSVQWTESATAPTLSQAARAGDTTAQDFTWRAQSAFAGATAHKDGGNLRVLTGTPASGGVAGSFIVIPGGGGEMLRVGPAGVSVSGDLTLKSTPPSPKGSGALYVDKDGNLIYKGPSGTAKQIAGP